ncbi:MAG: hypothetical protein H7831_08750, partial [Magnetococcus sp. WYHC-3]
MIKPAFLALGTLLRSLTGRILATVLLIIGLFGIGVYGALTLFVATVAGDTASQDLHRLGVAVYSVLDAELDRHLRSGRQNTTVAERIARAKARVQVGDFIGQYRLEGALLEADKVIFRSPAFAHAPPELLAARYPEGVHLASLDGQSHYLLEVEFTPWSWRILLARNAQSYTGILDHLLHVYLVMGLLLLLVGGVLLWLLHRAFQRPMAQILRTLNDPDHPLYQGTYEFEYLSKQIAHLAEGLREKTREAEAASRAKSAFLATMSHEIRTPLNAVLGMTELLRETPLDQRQGRYVELLHRSGENLLLIINDVLDIARIESGQLQIHYESFSPVKLAEEVTAMMQVTAKNKGLDVTFCHQAAMPSRVIGDPHRLRQVLVNLMGNAVKFTE